MGEVVSYEVVDRVAHVTIERPAKRNAMNIEVFESLARRAKKIADDKSVGAVVLAGRDVTFSSGIDLAVLAGQAHEGVSQTAIARLQAAFTAYEELDVPTIAAIEGSCFGAGLQLALACHVRAIAPGSEVAVMEARWGLVPDLGGTWRLPRLIGLGRATELVLTARRVGYEEALAIGLAEVALPADDPQGAAHDHAARLASGPAALRRIPRLLRDNYGVDRDTALGAESAAQLVAMAGPDVAEAVTALREGRDAAYEGR